MRSLAVSGLMASLLLPAVAALASPWQTPGADNAQILPVDEAFRIEPAEWREGRLQLRIAIAPNCYLYRDKLKLEAVEPDGYKLGAPQLAEGVAIHDEHFGDVRIFRNAVQVSWKPAAKTPPRKLKLSFQGCAENLVCYPPQTRIVDILSLP